MCRRVTSDSLVQSVPSKVTMVPCSSTECLYASVTSSRYSMGVAAPSGGDRNKSHSKNGDIYGFSYVYTWIEEYGRTLNKILMSHCSCDVQKCDVRFACPIRALQSYNGALLEYRMPICLRYIEPLEHGRRCAIWC
ncbi:hypothetical protein AVEN_97752-1 [Araneus ventricosus]|uniref:Uncharacterized protein n=1 Tax=Araneus ventricosus TaxID=182803 RepID=A0A4Y2E651_ARAVE|nr:hypothetical protein AVEN_97752-1 [Araneus ventricosus]